VPAAGLERPEDGGKLFREREEAAISRRLLIAKGMDKTAGGKTSAGDAVREPRLVDFRKEAGDLTPTGALARFAGIADEDEEEVQTVAGGIHHAVRSRADHVAEGRQKLEQNGGGMRLGVASDGADGEPGVAMERGHWELGRSFITKGGWGWGRRTGLLLWLVLWFTVNREAVQLSPAALCFRKG
jgi:hypothetical protein